MNKYHPGCHHSDDCSRYHPIYDLHDPADQRKEGRYYCYRQENLEYLVNGVPLLTCFGIVAVMFVIKSQRISAWTVRVYSAARLYMTF